MTDISILLVIISVETAVLICILIVLRTVTWQTFAALRDEVADLKTQNEALRQGRDGWRDAAERTLVIAQLGRNVGVRAATLVATLQTDTPTAEAEST